jgi:hypothetical protein
MISGPDRNLTDTIDFEKCAGYDCLKYYKLFDYGMIPVTAQAFISADNAPEEYSGIYYLVYQLYHAH